jgi:hypothetical protein
VDYDFEDDVTFHVFSIEDLFDVSFSVVTNQKQKGITLSVTRKNNHLLFSPSNARKNWKIVLRNHFSVQEVIGGQIVEVDKLGVTIKPGSLTGQVEVVY